MKKPNPSPPPDVVTKPPRIKKTRKHRCPVIRTWHACGSVLAKVWAEFRSPLIAAIAFAVVSIVVYVVWKIIWPDAAAFHAAASALIRPLMPHAPSPIPTPHPRTRHG